MGVVRPGGRRVVGGRRRADARRRSSVRRRVAEQQHPQPDLRLQRLRPARRQRVGQRGRQGGSPASMWGPTGVTRLFNAEFGNMMSWLLPGALGHGRGAARRHHPGPSHRSRARRPPALGRLAGQHRPRHQPGPGHHPPLLHGGARPAARRTGRHRHHGPVAAPGQLGRSRRPGRGSGRHRCLELRPPRPHLGLVPRAAPLRGRGRRARCRGHPGAPAAAQRAEARHRRWWRRSGSVPRWPRRSSRPWPPRPRRTPGRSRR